MSDKIAAKDSPFEGNAIGNATISVGVEGALASNKIRMLIQLQDEKFQDLKVRGHLLAYLSDDANGDSKLTTAPTGNVAVGVDGLCQHLITDKVFLLTSESDGDIDLDIVDSGTPTMYLVLCLPSGRLIVSSAITFA